MPLLHITTERLVLKPHTQNSLVWLNTTFNNPDELIGCGMIARINHYNRRCDLGIGLGWKRDNWGKGYASETLQAIVAYCFNELHLNRIGAEIYEFNERSIRLFERNGFRREGVFRQYIFKDGVFKDEYLYSLLREDWKR